MANFISSTGDYPRHIGDIQIENSSYKYGDALPDGWLEVELAEVPEYDPSIECLIELAPKEVNKVITQQWSTRLFTEEELARINAPITARAKLAALGLTADEIAAITR